MGVGEQYIWLLRGSCESGGKGKMGFRKTVTEKRRIWKLVTLKQSVPEGRDSPLCVRIMLSLGGGGGSGCGTWVGSQLSNKPCICTSTLFYWPVPWGCAVPQLCPLGCHSTFPALATNISVTIFYFPKICCHFLWADTFPPILHVFGFY